MPDWSELVRAFANWITTHVVAKPVADAALTVLVAVITYVLGQWIIRFFIEPWLDFRRHLGEISDSINYYANVGAGVERLYWGELEALSKEESVGLSRVQRLQAERLESLIRENWDRQKSAQESLRRQATQLLSKAEAVPVYWLFALLGCVPSRAGVLEAYSQLIGLSNSTNGWSGSDHQKIIAKSLRLSFVRKQRG